MLSFSAGVSTTFAGASLRTAPLSRSLPAQMGLSWTEYDGAKWDPLKLAKTPEKCASSLSPIAAAAAAHFAAAAARTAKFRHAVEVRPPAQQVPDAATAAPSPPQV